MNTMGSSIPETDGTRSMSAPEPIDEFDRLLANEDSLEKYVSLGLALEELLEKLRAKGFETEKETLSRLLELSPARAQLLELAAERLLDSQKRQDEQAFCAIRTILFNRFGLSSRRTGTRSRGWSKQH